ncbi:DUF6556 family protein [Streptococcus castoreus]|uniref:DUF6556 family protein n=1 Tax=Streptococcus castoreus TaxID=254786 RepID=UPI000402FA09|nr:DUF6556 family protein [Streptococcus castoreus]
MSSNYSRQQKSSKSGGVPTKHIKTGFTALQKFIALIGSILSIIVATITITRTLQPSSDSTSGHSSKESTSTVIKVIEKNTSQGDRSHTESSRTADENKPTIPSSTTPSDETAATSTSEIPKSTNSSQPNHQSGADETTPSLSKTP